MATDGQLIETDAHLCRRRFPFRAARHQLAINRRGQLDRLEIAQSVATSLAGRRQRVFDGGFEVGFPLAGALLDGLVRRQAGAFDHPAAAHFLRRQPALFDHVHHLPAGFPQQIGGLL